MNLLFEMENGISLNGLNKKEIERYLRSVNGFTNSHAVLENRDGSYMQVGGGPVEFTVEVRKYLTGDNFIHVKARQKQNTNTEVKKIIISGSVVDVMANQVLDMETVIRLFHSFLDGEYFPEVTKWDDITDMFR